MKVIHVNDTQALQILETPIVACIGYFDGLHLGHQVLIEHVKGIAKKDSIKSAMITFDPDPWSVVNDKTHVHHLTPIKEKTLIAESLGLDYLIILKFTKETSKLLPQEFVERYLIALNVQTLVVGEDFKFGFKGQGNVDYLKTHAKAFFHTDVMDISKTDEKKIGTTAISQAILRGDIAFANSLLGRPYEISGFVIDGQKQGRKIGFPTANLDIVDEYFIPSEGVYAGFVELDGLTYQSMMSIGYNPTFNHTTRLSVETHILDFDAMIYGKLLKQNFVAKIRDQIKFDSVEDLISQMKQDEITTREVLNGFTAKL